MAEGKWINGLTPDMPVADAARVVLAARFEVVRQYLPLAAAKPYEDVEYVHQLRVGTRRAGAALRATGADGAGRSAGAAAGASFSLRRRITGASRVDEGDLTNSPMSLAIERTALLSTPSSLASS